MQLKEHRKNFNQRWKIPSSKSYEEKFSGFRQQIINIFESVKMLFDDIHNSFYLTGIDEIVTNESALDFCQYYSLSKKITIIDRLHSENDEKEFYRLIEVILLLNIKKEGWESEKTKPYLIRKVTEAIEMSEVNVTIGQTKNGIILYPKGEKRLDEKLVNEALSFLNKDSNKYFHESLTLYESKKFRQSAESLCRSLEEFLRYKLGNRKGLKENIKILEKQLKNSSSQPEIRNLIFQTFSYLNNYFNEYVKHGDNLGEPENEFLIYQTALLMRYINNHILDTPHNQPAS